jgi:hypothetical protein
LFSLILIQIKGVTSHFQCAVHYMLSNFWCPCARDNLPCPRYILTELRGANCHQSGASAIDNHQIVRAYF